MKRFNLFASVSTVVFSVIVTIISAYMGYSIYISNNKTIASNVLSVYITDLRESIKGNLMLGKTVDNYFSLEDQLDQYSRSFDEIEELYVTDGKGNMIAGTGESEILAPEVSYLKSGYFSDENKLYCATEINEDLYLVAAADNNYVDSLRVGIFGNVLTFSVAGCVIVVIVMTVLLVVIKDKEKARRISLTVFSIWIFILGVFITQVNYRAYQRSVSMIENVVTSMYEYDMDKLQKAGVAYDDISGIEEYLSRYIDGIDEIALLTEHDGTLEYSVSRTYMNRVIMGYLVQTLMIFFFSMIIMAEFNIFIQDNASNGGKSGPESD